MVNIGKETEQIEYKKSTGELKEGVISIASILNKHGSGELYFGVKNNGDVIGQEITDMTLRDISQAISYHIKPVIYPVIDTRIFGDKEVAYVKFEGNRAPYLAYNIPRIRVADEDKVMDQETYDDMLRQRSDVTKAWELQVSDYSIDDIVKADFKSYLNKAKAAGRIEFESDEPEVVLNKLDLIAKDGVHLLNAGAALFCNCSTNDVQMAKFATDVKATFTDIRREDKGSIIGLCKVCEQYIIDAMDWKAEIIGLARVETPEIPVEAIREAIINSYGHRVYNNNQCNEIDVFKDRIEIHTTGGFPQGYTPEEFLDGNKKAIRRNKLITGVLYYSKDMETFATGLKRIKDLCDEAGCEVEFKTEKEDFVVIFYRNLRNVWNQDEKNGVNDVNGVKVGVKNGVNGVKVGVKNGVNEDDSRNAIIMCLKENEHISIAQLAKEIGISRRTIDRIIKQLKEEKIIEREGSSRSGRWIVHS